MIPHLGISINHSLLGARLSKLSLRSKNTLKNYELKLVQIILSKISFPLSQANFSFTYCIY